MPLSEKTLELNIISELTYLFRIAGRNPYYVGYTQLEELHTGTDIEFQNGHQIMFLQFKKGYRRRNFFTFYINNNRPHFNQHQTFIRHGAVANASRYVFPRIADNNDVNTFRGRFLTVTPFIPATRIGNLNPPDTHHRIRLWGNGRMTKHSQGDDIGKWKPLLSEQMTLHKIGKQEADAIIESFELPTLTKVLPKVFELVDEKKEKYESIFGLKRSGFCMIFESYPSENKE
ncbi:MAG: hypothetical protein V3U19_01285 [Thermodesulfobacteriota bacterium]